MSKPRFGLIETRIITYTTSGKVYDVTDFLDGKVQPETTILDLLISEDL